MDQFSSGFLYEHLVGRYRLVPASLASAHKLRRYPPLHLPSAAERRRTGDSAACCIAAAVRSTRCMVRVASMLACPAWVRAMSTISVTVSLILPACSRTRLEVSVRFVTMVWIAGALSSTMPRTFVHQRQNLLVHLDRERFNALGRLAGGKVHPRQDQHL